MKNVLLLIDSTKTSLNALSFALNLLECRFCTFFILNMENEAERLEELALTRRSAACDKTVSFKKKQLEKLLGLHRENNFCQSFEFLAIEESYRFSEAIERLCAFNKIEVVIMGIDSPSHHPGSFVDGLPQKLIEHCNCPVLFIPKRVKYKGIEDILFTVEYELEFNSMNLNPVFKILGKRNSKLTVFKMENEFISREEEEHQREEISKIHPGLVCSYYSICEVDTVEAVEGLVQIMPVDLNVLMVERQLPETFFADATVPRIFEKSSLPLLVLEGNRN